MKASIWYPYPYNPPWEVGKEKHAQCMIKHTSGSMELGFYLFKTKTWLDFYGRPLKDVVSWSFFSFGKGS